MRRALSSSVLVGFLMLTTNLGQLAAAGGGDPEKMITQLVDLSGVGEQLTALQDLVDQQTKAQAGQLEGEDGAFFHQTFRAAFHPVPIRASIVASLLENYDGDRAKAALEWYQSDLGSRVRAEEMRAQSKAAQRELASFVQSLQTTPPDPERLEIARRLDTASKASTTSMRVMEELLRGMFSGLSAMAGEVDPVPAPEEIDRIIEQQVRQLDPLIHDQTQLAMLFNGRNLSIEEDRSYLTFVESESGQWLHGRIADGMVHAMARAGTALGHNMAVWAQRKQPFDAEGKTAQLIEAARAEGKATGKNTEQSKCTQAAFERRSECRDLTCFAQSRAFLASCLDASEKDASVCSGVPSPDDLVSSVYWRLERCERRGTPTAACNDLMGTIQDYCVSRAGL